MVADGPFWPSRYLISTLYENQLTENKILLELWKPSHCSSYLHLLCLSSCDCSADYRSNCKCFIKKQWHNFDKNILLCYIIYLAMSSEHPQPTDCNTHCSPPQLTKQSTGGWKTRKGFRSQGPPLKQGWRATGSLTLAPGDRRWQCRSTIDTLTGGSPDNRTFKMQDPV